ncbi:MAG: inosine/xanthosine triphosphatase [Patescibacteria group bacterium]
MKIVVGSTSKHKLLAVEHVFKKIFHSETIQVEGAKVLSEINEQPIGHEETIIGVLNRLDSVKNFSKNIFDYAIAIENGLFEVKINNEERWFDIAWVVVEDSSGNKSLATSSGLEFSKNFVSETRRRGFKTTTVGSIIAEKTGCDDSDPQLFLTNNLVSRMEMLKQALEIALGQLQKDLVNKQL